VIDKFDAIGDNWRNRYPNLVLHDPVWFDHLPYLPFPESWPIYTPKDKIADWFQFYAKAMDLDVWTRTTIEKATFQENDANWTVDLRRVGPDGVAQTRRLHPKHIIMATGHSGKPRVPSIPGKDEFQGDVLCHSGDFPGPKKGSPGRKAVVIGACNSAMDIAQDYVENGHDVTIVQRSSTYVISSESTRKISFAVLYEEGGPPVEDADLTLWSFPSQVLKALQVDITTLATQHDKQMLEGLERAGFRVDYGPSNAGLFMKYVQRGGGYYLDVGAAKLIAEGKIKVKSGQEVDRILPRGVRLNDGTELEADEIVFATGYGSMRETAEEILGEGLPDGVGDVWGWDWEGEMRGIWRATAQPGLWFQGGNLAFARYYSRVLALQILARLKGLV
jgi:cation diffusion facilitator CzcD-associated flavoprotein CzcO